MTLEMKGLQKSYGSKRALVELDLNLPRGEVLGLLGTNGAGKTTTLKILLGLIKPDAGHIDWDGSELDRSKLSIGYLPEERGLFTKSRVIDQLRLFGGIEGMKRRDLERSIDEWLEKLKMTEYRTKRANELSKGNQQKIQFIAALLHNPELIILDEPFSGLDPVNADLLSDIIGEEIKKGKTVILSSHRIEKIEDFCNSICILKNGKVVLKGDLDEIKQNYEYQNLFITANKEIEDYLIKRNVPFTKKAKDIYIRTNTYQEAMVLVNQLQQQSLHPRNLKLVEPSLNEIFLEKVNAR
ncbi:ABC transporter ATP-binding protein [Neobacillus mesonae]|uniref:ABC transporter ATP-binding protein n=1 Tax=Neobacillus mesonae TaxID=1193713 RepID=UPI002E1E4D1B|nr:ATP-binding cassette domain-containing protein [Neobacillus mesonae]MED4206667.1 ATP-binding cassette domain-containing protein [Neobacillus mesonae]